MGENPYESPSTDSHRHSGRSRSTGDRQRVSLVPLGFSTAWLIAFFFILPSGPKSESTLWVLTITSGIAFAATAFCVRGWWHIATLPLWIAHGFLLYMLWTFG